MMVVKEPQPAHSQAYSPYPHIYTGAVEKAWENPSDPQIRATVANCRWTASGTVLTPAPGPVD